MGFSRFTHLFRRRRQSAGIVRIAAEATHPDPFPSIL